MSTKKRTKKQLTPEEMIKELMAAKVELEKERSELDNEFNRMKGMNLENINEIIGDELEEMKEELKEIDDKITELKKPQPPAV